LQVNWCHSNYLVDVYIFASILFTLLAVCQVVFNKKIDATHSRPVDLASLKLKEFSLDAPADPAKALALLRLGRTGAVVGKLVVGALFALLAAPLL
jgi:hypothetical protein